GDGLPAGEYALCEMFCDERGCDCRRVFLCVVCQGRPGMEAVIAYGWEDAAFYAEWLHDGDPEMVAELQGPVLNMGSPAAPWAPILLELVKRFALGDAAYVERIKRHYLMFRDKVERRRSRRRKQTKKRRR
ncbi:MAG: hypothetical protein IH624_12745, partial [Phycisphaerae bacterium]|nr:hypothetical protein [Phycisphaerae bacterium]